MLLEKMGIATSPKKCYCSTGTPLTPREYSYPEFLQQYTETDGYTMTTKLHMQK